MRRKFYTFEGMYRLNITFVVEPPVQERWLELMRSKFIPFLRDAGYDDLTFSRVISVEAVDHLTYSLLVAFDSMVDHQRITRELFNEYTAVAEPLFGVQVLWFMSLMKTLEP